MAANEGATTLEEQTTGAHFKYEPVAQLKNQSCTTPPFVWYRGFGLPTQVTDHVDEIDKIQVDPSDVIVCGFLKTGTSWTMEVLSQLRHPEDDPKAPDRQTLAVRVPTFEDFVFGLPAIRERGPPREMRTHYHYQALPESFFKARPKIIYTLRNPRDTCVSYFHYYKLMRGYNFTGSFDDFFEGFVSGIVGHGPFWKHIQGFWTNQHKLSIHFVRYEEMLQNFNKELRRIADFLGCELTEERLDAISKSCKFDSLKDDKKFNYDWWRERGVFDFSKTHFMRKGQAGDWRNYFSTEQIERMNALVDRELTPLGVEFNYGV